MKKRGIELSKSMILELETPTSKMQPVIINLFHYPFLLKDAEINSA